MTHTAHCDHGRLGSRAPSRRRSCSARPPPPTRSRARPTRTAARDSIWDAFARVPGAVVNGDNGEVACDHYHRYREDVALMADLGLQTYRFSTSWSRVRPDGGAVNPRASTSTRAWSTSCSSTASLPWLTLYHWDLPQALQEKGGWANRDTAERFAEYALERARRARRPRDVVDARSTSRGARRSSATSAASTRRAARSRPRAWPRHTTCCSRHGLAVGELRARDPALEPRHHAQPHGRRPGRSDRRRRPRRRAPHRRPVQPLLPRPDLPRRVSRGRARGCRAATGSTRVVRPGDLESISTPDRHPRRELLPRRARGRAPPGGRRGDERRAIRPPEAVAVPDRRRASTGISRGLPRTSMDWEVQPEGLTRLLQRVHARVHGARRRRALRHRERRAPTTTRVEADGVVARRRARRRSCERTSAPMLDAIDAGVRRARLLLLVAARQLRVGLGLRQAVRHRARRLRHPGAHPEGSALEYRAIIGDAFDVGATAYTLIMTIETPRASRSADAGRGCGRRGCVALDGLARGQRIDRR